MKAVKMYQTQMFSFENTLQFIGYKACALLLTTYKKCCARGRCQGQGQVITPHNTCGV